jgi:hypothetical protein
MNEEKGTLAEQIKLVNDDIDRAIARSDQARRRYLACVAHENKLFDELESLSAQRSEGDRS